MTWSFLKFVLTIAVVLLLAINSCADPHNLTFFIGESRPDYKPDTRAAAFALIAAIAAFVTIVPRGYGILAGLTTFIARLTPLAGAALAGWFWFYAATGENPRPYLNEVWTIAILFVLLAFGLTGFGLGTYAIVGTLAFVGSLAWRTTKPVCLFVMGILLNLSVLTLVWSVLLLIAFVLCLWAFGKVVWQLIKATYHHIRGLFP